MTKPKLRRDQKEGIEFILNAFKKYKGALLADRPGLGKTAQAIEVMKTVRSTKVEEPQLVTAPAYLVYNWLDEFEMWGLKDHLCVIDSTKQELYDAQLYIGSYNMVSHDNIFKQLFKKKFSLITCDEAHTFRTWNSKRSSRIIGTFKNKKSNLLYNADNILTLTGTPIVNRVEELYNLIIRIAPDALKHMVRQEFIFRYSKYAKVTPWGVKSFGIKNEEELKSLLKYVMLGRRVIKGLKEAIVNYIPLQIKGAEIKRLLAEEEEFLQKQGIGAGDIIDLQDMSLMEREHFAIIRQRIALLKLPLIMEAVTDEYELGHRPLVYTWHRGVQTALVEKLQKQYPKAHIGVINGGVSAKRRSEIVAEYQAGKIDILCPTIGALREGVNITEGRVILFLELPYTPAEEEQVIARVNRTGQKNQVYAKLFYLKRGVDKHVINLLKEKAHVIKKVRGE